MFQQRTQLSASYAGHAGNDATPDALKMVSSKEEEFNALEAIP